MMPSYRFVLGEPIAPQNLKSLNAVQCHQLYLVLVGEPPKRAVSPALLRARWKETEAELCEFWQVSGAENPEIVFDVWYWNADTARVFKAGTTDELPVPMIQGSFSPEVAQPTEDLEELAYALNLAFSQPRAYKIFEHCIFNEAGEIADFAEGHTPQTAQEWNAYASLKPFASALILAYAKRFKGSNWLAIAKKSRLTEDVMERVATRNLWEVFCQYQTLSEVFIRKHAAKVDWRKISYYQTLSEVFIVEFQDKLAWEYLSCAQKHLSEDFIRQYQERFDWRGISWAVPMSEAFMREFREKIFWSEATMYQTFSEDFMREMQDKIDWHYASAHQKMSIDFVREFKEKINIRAFSYNRHMTGALFDAFSEEILVDSLVYYSGRAQEVLTESRLLSLRARYPHRAFWKGLFARMPYLSKDFKKDFLESLGG